MPRKLPWLVDDDVKEAKKSKLKSEPKANVELPSRDAQQEDDQNEDSARDYKARGVDFLRSSRSPPTSPLQAPVKEEFMREGLDHDDKYIMVEDEFYAVAQTFTRHLHHAEYVRRRKMAKAENASVIKELARPTDNRTKMRPETVKRKEAEKLKDRQYKALEVSARGRPMVDSEEESEAEKDDPDTDLIDDPWVGTRLYDFMTSPRKAKSLIGLERIKSSTRAAAGYGQTSDKRPAPSPLLASELGRVQPSRNAEEGTASEDDELEPSYHRDSSLPKGHALKARATIKQQTPLSKLANTPSRSTRREASTVSKPTIPRASTAMDMKKRSLLDELDDFSSEGNFVPDQPRETLSNKTSAVEGGPTRESKKSRLNDVPTFLI